MLVKYIRTSTPIGSASSIMINIMKDERTAVDLRCFVFNSRWNDEQSKLCPLTKLGHVAPRGTRMHKTFNCLHITMRISSSHPHRVLRQGKFTRNRTLHLVQAIFQLFAFCQFAMSRGRQRQYIQTSSQMCN